MVEAEHQFQEMMVSGSASPGDWITCRRRPLRCPLISW